MQPSVTLLEPGNQATNRGCICADLSQKPDLALPAVFGDRRGVARLSDIQANKNFAILSHGSSPYAEDRPAQCEQPSFTRAVWGASPPWGRTYGLTKYRRERLEELRCWDGQPLPPRLKAELLRELQRLELVLSQISAVEAERDLALKQAGMVETISAGNNAGALLVRLKGIGPEIASVLSSETFFRCFGNRREVAAYAGLTPSPWQSGGIEE
jgi:Transposase IS116/IS110/IS902 family